MSAATKKELIADLHKIIERQSVEIAVLEERREQGLMTLAEVGPDADVAVHPADQPRSPLEHEDLLPVQPGPIAAGAEKVSCTQDAPPIIPTPRLRCSFPALSAGCSLADCRCMHAVHADQRVSQRQRRPSSMCPTERSDVCTAPRGRRLRTPRYCAGTLKK